MSNPLFTVVMAILLALLATMLIPLLFGSAIGFGPDGRFAVYDVSAALAERHAPAGSGGEPELTLNGPKAAGSAATPSRP